MKKTLLFFLLFICQCSAFALAETIQSVSGLDLLSNKTMTFHLEQTTKKASVVVFLSAKCPCSNSHVETLNSLTKQYPDFQFIGVHSNFNETLDESKKYFTSMKLAFPVLQDEKTKIADQLKALKTPHSYVISTKGEILYQGGVSDSANALSSERKYLAEALEDVSKGIEVRTKKVRSLGCAIQRENENVW